MTTISLIVNLQPITFIKSNLVMILIWHVLGSSRETANGFSLKKILKKQNFKEKNLKKTLKKQILQKIKSWRQSISTSKRVVETVNKLLLWSVELHVPISKVLENAKNVKSASKISNLWEVLTSTNSQYFCPCDHEIFYENTSEYCLN